MDCRDYWLHTTLTGDPNDGIVWIREPSLRSELLGRRRIVRISACDAHGHELKHFYAESLYAEEGDLERFEERLESRIERLKRGSPPGGNGSSTNRIKRLVESQERLSSRGEGDNFVFMSSWHRQKLNLDLSDWGDKPGPRRLTIKPGGFPRIWWQYRAGVEHPQIAVHMATVIAIIGIGLALAGTGLGIAFAGSPGAAPAAAAVIVGGAVFLAIGVVAQLMRSA
jgi:hypothetical protein